MVGGIVLAGPADSNRLSGKKNIVHVPASGALETVVDAVEVLLLLFSDFLVLNTSFPSCSFTFGNFIDILDETSFNNFRSSTGKYGEKIRKRHMQTPLCVVCSLLHGRAEGQMKGNYFT